MLSRLLSVSRRTPKVSEREAILRRQHDRCAICNGVFDDDVEFDHVAALKTLVGSQAQCFQALCASCHAEKTTLETGASRSIESRFSPRAWNDYVSSPKPPPLAWEPHTRTDGIDPEETNTSICGDYAIELDVIRCRRQALAYSSHEFSVFCALDTIVEHHGTTLGDFNFITRVRDARKCALGKLPFVGQGWYHRCAAEFLLEHGTCGWQDITWTFTSTGRLPADAFRSSLETMEAAWDDQHLAKLSVNSMIGLWAIRNSESLSCISSNDMTDGVGRRRLRKFGYGHGKIMNDHIFENGLLDNASMRPIHDQILHTEYLRVAQLVHAIRMCGVPMKCITAVKTDCVNIERYAKKRHRALTEIENLRLCDLPNATTTADPLCFRVGDVKPLNGTHSKPHIHTEPPMVRTGWTDLSERLAMAHVLNNGSLLVLGAPGVGKTHWVREIVRQIEGRVDVIAKCHASCRNFGPEAVTADHWVRKTVRCGRLHAKTVVIEEISQISAYLWNDIAKAAMMGVRFILMGDFAQLDPVLDTWCGAIVPDGMLQRSDLLHELTRGMRLVLTENHRSDEALFAFYTGLRVEGSSQSCLFTETDAVSRETQPRALSEALAEARCLFPETDGFPSVSLVLSHATRMRLNWTQNLAEKTMDAVWLKYPKGKNRENQAQSCWIYEGQRLIGAGGRVRKGLFVIVAGVTRTEIILDDGQTLKHADCGCLRLSHAITYASCQGLTLEGRVRLCECSHPAFTLKHLYVGSSRCTAAALLEVSK